MARCKRCNRFLLFSTKSGYCSNCDLLILKENAEAERKAREDLERRLQEESYQRHIEEELKQKAEDARRAEEEHQRRIAEERRAEEARQRQLEENRKAEEKRRRAAEKARKIEEERRLAAEEARKAEEVRQRQAEESRKAAEVRLRQAEEARKIEEQRRHAAEKARKAEEERQRQAEEARRIEELQRRTAEETRKIEEERQHHAEEARRIEEQQRRSAEENRKAEEEHKHHVEEARRVEEQQHRTAEEPRKAEEERKHHAVEARRVEEQQRRTAEEPPKMEEEHKHKVKKPREKKEGHEHDTTGACASKKENHLLKAEEGRVRSKKKARETPAIISSGAENDSHSNVLENITTEAINDSSVLLDKALDLLKSLFSYSCRDFLISYRLSEENINNFVQLRHAIVHYFARLIAGVNMTLGADKSETPKLVEKLAGEELSADIDYIELEPLELSHHSIPWAQQFFVDIDEFSFNDPKLNTNSLIYTPLFLQIVISITGRIQQMHMDTLSKENNRIISEYTDMLTEHYINAAERITGVRPQVSVTTATITRNDNGSVKTVLCNRTKNKCDVANTKEG